MADNNPQLQSVDRFQKAYIEQEKYHERKVRTIRVMILVLFLALWELCTRLDMVDDFIFIIKKENRIRLTANLFCQLTRLIIADIARR